MNDYDLGKNLMESRIKARLSRNALAEAAGLNGTTIEAIENNKSNPTFKTVNLIAKALNADVVDLITGKKLKETKCPCCGFVFNALDK